MCPLTRLALVAAVFLGASARAAPVPDSLAMCTDSQNVSIALPSCLATARNEARSAADRAVGYVTAGLIRLSAQDFDTAMTYFGQALALNPNSDAAYAARADAELASGDYNAAAADARKAVALKPNEHPDAYLVLGTLTEGDARVQFMNRTIALAPDYAPAYAGRSRGYEQEQQYDLALADLDKAGALDASLVAGLRQRYEIILTQRGGLSMERRQYQAAIDDFTRALGVNNASVRALNDRGDAYNVTSQFQKAIADLSRAIKIDPSYAAAYGNRGVSYAQTGQDSLALPDLDKAINSGGATASLLVVRGKVHQRASDPRAALADFHRALALMAADAPGRTDIQAMVDALGSIR